MADVLITASSETRASAHAAWVRISHSIVALSVLLLTVSGLVILMAHPRLYWGNAGNDLTPALIELPIGPNYRHGGWDKPRPFFQDSTGPVSASRIKLIFNLNGPARSLHFLAAWWLVVTGAVYLFSGIFGAHFRSHIWPSAGELTSGVLRREIIDHLRLRIPTANGGPQYGLLQKCAYSLVIFVAAPLMVVTGLTMSPAMTAAFPLLLQATGGYQSARTIHFATSVALVLFVLVHLAMVVKSGLRRQLRAITLGK